MHVITNMMGCGGAEMMLSRLVSHGSETATIVPLMDVAERHLHLESSGAATIRPLKVRSRLGMVRAVHTLSRLIVYERPDAVMCWLYHAMIVGQCATRLASNTVPVFWNVRQSLDDPDALTWNTHAALRLSRRLSKRADGIIFNSSRALDLHRAYGFSNAHMSVIPNGFVRAPGNVVIAEKPRIIGIAGRFHKQKDYPTFFEAAARVHRSFPTVRFIAVGDGMTADNAAIRALLDLNGLPMEVIDLRGNITDMACFYREIDALALSSRTEGFPNVVAEAMSYGKPAISTDVGDAAFVVGDTGFIVPPARPKDLAKAMRDLLDLSTERYATLSTAARKRIEHLYSIERAIRAYHDFMSPRPVAIGLAT
ncbi:glycosyltransferase [Pararhizobium mangrovi]|uniref:Glycosyltransferase n=2 Tax=Pararhizobium mangrovi TaxID=2590452 RepID=A0A506U7S1_9HYPH|nr:glycosyltransferase [Pararhizobium mangrovi]